MMASAASMSQHDAHSVAVAALRTTTGLRRMCVDDATRTLRLLAGRRDTLGWARTETKREELTAPL